MPVPLSTYPLQYDHSALCPKPPPPLQEPTATWLSAQLREVSQSEAPSHLDIKYSTISITKKIPNLQFSLGIVIPPVAEEIIIESKPSL